MSKQPPIFPNILLLAAIVLSWMISGCADPSSPHNSTTRQNPAGGDSISAQQTRDSAYLSQPGESGMTITLPVIDALFFEEGFAQSLKEALGITEEQVQRLKAAARESVAGLAEDANKDYSGSSRDAAKRSEEQLNSIIGEAKSRELITFVNQRYETDDAVGVMPTAPNAVPADTRIVVNGPAFRLDIFEDGHLIKTYRIGIGYPEFPLPTGMRRAENIIFNPTWTPPDEPWVKGSYSPGTPVAPGSPMNPLGPVKIPIGLPSLIHGGKAITRLGGFASHGCVAMTNDQVQDFAVALSRLTGSSLTLDEALIYGKQKRETRTVELTRPVPVELRYETIVADSGSLRIYRDVYERGTNTLENARRVLEVYGVAYESLSAAEKIRLVQALQQMNRGPAGEPIVSDVQAAGQSTNGQVPDSGAFSGVASSKLEGAKQGKETTTVKGGREMLVSIAALQGRGYPRPVNLHTGEKPKPVKAASKQKGKRY